MTGFVEFRGGHFIAYVRQKSGWVKCDDSVVSRLEAGVTGRWPSVIFLEKLRRQGRVEPAVCSSAPGALFARLPGLLAAAVTGDASDWQRRVVCRTEPPASNGATVKVARKKSHRHWAVSKLALTGSSRKQKRAGRKQKRTGRQQKRTGRKQKDAGRKQKRTDRQQKRTGRQQKRTGRKQKDAGRRQDRADRTQERAGPREGDRKRPRRDDDRTRNVRGRQERILGATTWSNNMSGHRTDKVNDEDNPFNRFVYAFPLRRDHAEEDLREWLHEPTVVAAQPCLLCQEGFEHRDAFVAHVDAVHGGLQRYRNACWFLESLCPHVVTAQEVRVMCYCS